VTSDDLIEVTRVSQSADGQPVVTKSTVTRAAVDSMVNQRVQAMNALNGVPGQDVKPVRSTDLRTVPTLNQATDPAQVERVSSALTQCSVQGQPAGSSCPSPCTGNDLWIYDQPNRIGHKMLCLENEVHFYLPSIIYDQIDNIGWDWFAVSAWGASTASTAYCYLGSTQNRTTSIGVFQIVNNLDCVFPNSHSDNGHVEWVTFP
jgi:hypothetical protein